MNRHRRYLDLWFAVFPVWSTVYYVWFFCLIIPAGGHVSPFENPETPRYISWPMFGLSFVCLALVTATFLTTGFLLERRMPGDSRRWGWILLALAIPPLGCPLAYFRTRSEPVRP